MKLFLSITFLVSLSVRVVYAEPEIIDTNTPIENPVQVEQITEEVESLLPQYNFDDGDYGYDVELINSKLEPIATQYIGETLDLASWIRAEVFVSFARTLDGVETGEEYGSGYCDLELFKGDAGSWTASGDCDRTEWDEDYDF